MTTDIPKGPKFRILLAEDHALIRQVLRGTLGTNPNLLIVGEAVNGDDAVSMASHRMKLSDAPDGYKTFRDMKDGCIKIVMTP